MSIRYERIAFTIMLVGHIIMLFLKTYHSPVSTNFTTRFFITGKGVEPSNNIIMLVPEAGFEPARLAAEDFKSPVSTISPFGHYVLQIGFEPICFLLYVKNYYILTQNVYLFHHCKTGATCWIRTNDKPIMSRTLYH